MLKRRVFWLLVLSAGGIMRLGIECLPEPDINFDLFANLAGA